MLLHKLLLQCALSCPSDRVLHCCQQNQRRPSPSTVEEILYSIGNSILQYFFLNVLMLSFHLCVAQAVKYEVRIFAGYDCVSVAAPI